MVGPDGSIWAAAFDTDFSTGVFRGLVRYDGSAWSFIPYDGDDAELCGSCFGSPAVGRDGVVWFGRRVGEDAAPVLSWDGDRDEVGRALVALVGEDAVRLTEEGAEVALTGSPAEIKPRLVEAVLRAGGRLQKLEDRGPTLEDLFLRLTGRGSGGRRREPEEGP